jgi:hypothetical protein
MNTVKAINANNSSTLAENSDLFFALSDLLENQLSSTGSNGNSYDTTLQVNSFVYCSWDNIILGVYSSFLPVNVYVTNLSSISSCLLILNEEILDYIIHIFHIPNVL